MNILITNEEGIGNSILKLPVCMALKIIYPDCNIDTIASDRNYELCKSINIYNKVYRYSHNLIIDEYYDLVFDAVFTSGVFYKCSKSYKTLLRVSCVDYYNKHEVQHNLDAISYNGTFIPALHPNIITALDKADRIAISTGCLNTPAWRNRWWAVERWAELIKKLWGEYHIPFILIGTDNEREFSNAVYEKVKHDVNIYDFIGKADIVKTLCLLADCKLAVTLDSGVMHLACSVDTNVISLWGPTYEVKSHPWVSPHKYAIIRADVDCGGCYIKNKALFKSCRDNKCMRNITADMVIEEIKKREWL